jgi:hypothetical protein
VRTSLPLAAFFVVVCISRAAAEQGAPNQSAVPASSGNVWTIGFDGVVFGTFNRQGGLRGDTEFVSQNWAMVMGMRPLGGGMFAATGMLSAEPATVRGAGYSQILQFGEAYRGLQITDRQHPHDLFMQLSAAWRVPLGSGLGLTIAGGPRGEAPLGPVAFMHRASSAENPTAPLSHHILDSTHIATGVLMVGLDRGAVTVEGGWFRAREPDERRYNLEMGRLDSWSARVWIRPGPEWMIQGSHGFLNEPELLEPGDQRRTNGSVSWTRQRESGFTAVTFAAGRNARTFSTVRAFLAEFTHQAGRTSVYGRFEDVTVETEVLLFPEIVHKPHPDELVDPVRTVTTGIVWDVVATRGFSVGVGGDVSFYRLPEILQFTHGSHPMSYRLFFRIRPPSRGGRMWNVTMGQPMSHGGMVDHGAMDHPQP